MSFKKTSFVIIAALLFTSLFSTGKFSPISFAENDEAELFLVAQKAFDDGFYDVAIRYIEQFFEKYPQTTKRVQANQLLGQCYFFKGIYLKAFDIFQNLLASPELKDITLYWLGETYLKGADYVQAEKQYRQLIDVYPNSYYVPQALYSLGWALYDQKNYDDARKTFQEFVQRFPTHELAEDSSYKVAECQYNLHAYPEAAESFHKYVTQFTQSKRHDQAYFYMAESNYYLDKYQDAADYYRKAAEISSDDKMILSSKISSGWCYFKLRDFDKAKQFFDEAQTLSKDKNIPSDDIDLGRATLFYEMNDLNGALEAYTHLIATFPNSSRIVEAYLGRANTLYALKNYPEAITQFQQLIEKFDKDPNNQEIVEKAYFGLAWTYLKNNNIDLSIKIFQNVASQTNNKAVKISALTQVGDAYQDINDYDKAIAVYDQILKDSPDSIYTDYIQYRQGIALLKQDKIEAATLSFQTLQTNFPKSKYLSDVKYYLGLAYYKKGDWAAAKEQLSDFLKNSSAVNEFQSDAQYILAVSMFNLQDYNEAMKIFQKITKNYSDQTALVSNCEINIAKCIYNLGDAKEALKKFKIIAYKYPKTDAGLEALLWLGDYYLKTSDFNNAVTYFQQTIQDFPGSEKIGVAHYGLGQAYQEQGTLDKALSEYKLVGNTSDQELSAKTKLSIADIFSKDADTSNAIETYKKITETSPEFSRDAYLKIADAYQDNHDYENAIGSFEQALKSDQGASKVSNAEILFSIADLYETLNKTNSATETYLKIPYLYPAETQWIVKSLLRLARIFEKANDWENAKLVYTKIVAAATEESKFAQERLDWIAENIKPK